MTALLMATLALGGMAIAEQKPMIQPTLLSSSERVALEAMMAEHIQLTLKGMTPDEGQLFPVKVIAKFDAHGMLLVELGRRFVVKPDGNLVSGVELQDQLEALDGVMGSMVTEVKYEGIDYLFEGKNILYYFPELDPGKGVKAQPGALSFPPYLPPPVYGDPARAYIPSQPLSRRHLQSSNGGD